MDVLQTYMKRFNYPNLSLLRRVRTIGYCLAMVFRSFKQTPILMMEVTKSKAKTLFKNGVTVFCVPSSVPVELSTLNLSIDRKYHLDFDYHYNRLKELFCKKGERFLFYVEPVEVKVASSAIGYNVLLGDRKVNKLPITTDKLLVRFLNGRMLRPMYPGALIPSIRNQLITTH